MPGPAQKQNPEKILKIKLNFQKLARRLLYYRKAIFENEHENPGDRKVDHMTTH